jgi:hypothetical protein
MADASLARSQARLVDFWHMALLAQAQHLELILQAVPSRLLRADARHIVTIANF